MSSMTYASRDALRASRGMVVVRAGTSRTKNPHTKNL